MKRNKAIYAMGALVLTFGAAVMTGCDNSKGVDYDSPYDNYPRYVTVTYDLSDCKPSGLDYNDDKPAEQTVKKGEAVELAKDGCKSTRGGEWKAAYVVHKSGKVPIGWSKGKDGVRLDYRFGETITPDKNLTLYPALTKYGTGDVIDGKTIIFVRNGSTASVQTGFLFQGKYTTYNVAGTDWRYITADVASAKVSQNRKWASSAQDVMTAEDIGAGKENTKKIIAAYSGDTEANNAAKYCQNISAHDYLPSLAESYLIFNAIRYKTIKDIPTYSQTTTTGGQFSTSTALFWTSTQQDSGNAYALNMCSDDVIVGGKKYSCGKYDYSTHSVYTCPVAYYDDDGKAID